MIVNDVVGLLGRLLDNLSNGTNGKATCDGCSSKNATNYFVKYSSTSFSEELLITLQASLGRSLDDLPNGGNQYFENQIGLVRLGTNNLSDLV